jgi:hypothetical protein
MNLRTEITAIRAELLKYRMANQTSMGNTHVCSIEISIGLLQYYLEYDRPISETDEGWFRAGMALDASLDAYEWRDLLDKYYDISQYVYDNNFFRNK